MDIRRYLVGTSTPPKRARNECEVNLDSPQAVKNFLTAEGIEFDDADPLRYLQGRVRARLRRKLSPAERVAEWNRCSAEAAVGTLGNVKQAMDALAERCDHDATSKDRLFTSARFVIDELPDEQVVKCKHHAEWNKCRGNIVRGQCRQCRVHTPGVLGYSFVVRIRDEAQQHDALIANVSDKGGASLFGMSAVQFNALTHAEKRKQLQRLTGASAFVKVIVAYKPGDELFLNTIYDMFLSDL